MTTSFVISGSIGTNLFAEDILYTSSHPTTSNTGMDTHWTKNPQYAPISLVPLKAGVLDQFRRTARAVSGENESLADFQSLETELKEFNKQVARLDTVNAEIQQFVANNEFKECEPH